EENRASAAHAARHRILASANGSASLGARAEAKRLDSRQLARSDSLRRDAAADHSAFHARSSPLERAGNLSFRSRFWRDGPPPARMTGTLEGFYGCGLPFITPGGIHALQ